ncbi:unnamed protein product [Polarella glacialis]|uniref:Uncharacterized protein n=1 Tax=Polarella glacialis TaxID=89957 RepID=A0A813E910_POLGL|nr:unnamed protein product [Polarella glacialis]
MQKDESKATNDFKMLFNQLKTQIDTAVKQIAGTKTKMSASQQDENEAGDSLNAARKERTEDDKYLDDMKIMCSQKEDDYAHNTKLRQQYSRRLTRQLRS